MEFKETFIERFRNILKEEFAEFIEANKRPLRKSFRINSLKVKSKEETNNILNAIRSKGLKLKSVPWYDKGFFVEYQSDIRTDLGNLYEHFNGKIYVQEATSMIPPLVLELESLKNGSLILDMAAAPGSKSTQIVELTEDKCILVANEKDFRRIAPLKINLERIGAKNVIIINEDGVNIDISYKFDRILLDAPCSGSGIIRKSVSAIKYYNPKKLINLQSLQKKLFKRAVELLKKEGILVYSTCSIDPEENEFIVNWALKNFKNLKLIKIDLQNIKRGKTINNFNDIKISKEIQNKTLRLWPHNNDTGGFFIAKFRKE